MATTDVLPVHFRRHRFPAEIIDHAVWLYYRFPLSFRDVEDLMAARGIEASFQTVSEWAAKFGLSLRTSCGGVREATLPIAAMSITFPLFRFDSVRKPDYVRLLLVAGQTAPKSLGFEG